MQLSSIIFLKIEKKNGEIAEFLSKIVYNESTLQFPIPKKGKKKKTNKQITKCVVVISSWFFLKPRHTIQKENNY